MHIDLPITFRSYNTPIVTLSYHEK